MSIRYLSNLALTLIAGFLIIATQAFLLPVVAWIGFGLSIALLALGAATMLIPPLAQRVMGGTVAVIATWTIVASLVFAPATAMWLIFASAIAMTALGVAGLSLHELRTERVVHSLEVTGAAAREREGEYASA